jgi:hypothetical protein
MYTAVLSNTNRQYQWTYLLQPRMILMNGITSQYNPILDIQDLSWYTDRDK